MLAAAVHKSMPLRTANAAGYLIENTLFLENLRRNHFRTPRELADKGLAVHVFFKCLICRGLCRTAVL
jgi:hypothetical protein